jgi:mannose-6-phosphate isomerase
MTNPEFEQRPWGRFWVLSDAADGKVKRLEVDPGQRLSYQRHAKRREHWLVVAGVASITLDDVEHTRRVGEAIDVPQGAWHRLANRGDVVLAVVEVQLGTYFGEDDIERRSDDYGRAGA